MLNFINPINKVGKSIDAIKEFNNNIETIFKFIGKVWNVLTHPSLLFAFIESSAFVICIIIVCVAIVAYAVGVEKASKWVSGSMAVYIIIKMIGTVI